MSYQQRAAIRAERRRRSMRRDETIETILFILGVVVVVMLTGFAGGVEQGTIHVFGL